MQHSSGSYHVKLFPSCLYDFAQGLAHEAQYYSLYLTMQKTSGRLPSLSVHSEFHPCYFIIKTNIYIEKRDLTSLLAP